MPDNNTVVIDFSEKVIKNPALFDYTENQLYNFSMPLLSIILSLPRLPKPENLALFKGLLKQNIVELSEQGKALEYPSAVIDKLCCLHCIVLDEFIIHSTWGADAGWENNTLLSELFGLKNGGELFFTITEKAMKQSAKMADLLQMIFAFLQIGFKGRYRSRQAEQLGIVTKEVNKTISDSIDKADVLIKEQARTKSLLLKNGARYFSFTVFIVVVLASVITFFDYWFKESYALRSKEFMSLKNNTANYILNGQTKDIIYLSTEEDIHSVKSLTQPAEVQKSAKQNATMNEQHTQESTIKVSESKSSPLATEQSTVNKVSLEQVNSRYYRVQLATFSVEKNANKYLSSLVNSQYKVSIKSLGSYFILYTSSKTLIKAKQQQQYFSDNYQLSAVINLINSGSQTK